MPSLSNRQLDFAFDLTTATWRLRPAGAELPALEGVRAGLTWHAGQRRPQPWRGGSAEVLQAGRAESAHGPAATLAVAVHSTEPAGAALAVTLEFVLPDDHPCLCWRLRVRNQGEQPFHLHELDLAVVGARFGFGPAASALRLHPQVGELAFFSNGYQSWSFAGAQPAGGPRRLSRFNWLEGPKLLNLRTPVVTGLGHFTSDMFAVLGDTVRDVGVVLGFTTQREQFGHVEALVVDPRAPYLRLAAHGDDVAVPPGGERVTDWAYVEFIRPSADDPLGAYTRAVARANAARVPARTPVGWCSWYRYFDRITEQAVLANVDALANLRARLPLDFVQIDDGYQAQVGDWFETKPTFPHGLAWLAHQIRARGCTPGLWLAPYIVRSDARLNDQHPDWFLRDARGRRVNAGFNWLRRCYALDPTHPAVRAHVRRLIETAVGEWGFPYLKLDFLYAAALPAQRYDATLTRAQAMRLALEDIRAAAGPDTFLLGCGCPLGPAVGLVDGMRISTDVAPNWNPELLGPVFSRWVESELGFVSARNAVHNILSRAPLHRRWWLNDPDCLLVREEATRLTEAEVRCLATVIALSGGMFLVSDDLAQLSPERQRYIAALLPVLDKRARAPGWLSERMPDTLTLALDGPVGRWQLAGLFNWGARARSREVTAESLGLPRGAYWAADFWAGTVTRLAAGQTLSLALPSHGASLLALRPVVEAPTWVASSFHFSQGREVTEWQADARALRFRLTLGRVAEGSVQLALPAAPLACAVDGRPLTAELAGPGRYSLAFPVDGTAEVRVAW